MKRKEYIHRRSHTLGLRFLLHPLVVHAEAEQRLLQFGIVGCMAVLFETEHQVCTVIPSKRYAILKVVLPKQELFGLLQLGRGIRIVGEGFLIVGCELRRDFMFKFYFCGHLSCAHCELWDMLKALAGGYLAARSVRNGGIAPKVVYYLKGGILIAFCLHAFDQIILIAPLTRNHDPSLSAKATPFNTYKC